MTSGHNLIFFLHRLNLDLNKSIDDYVILPVQLIKVFAKYTTDSSRRPEIFPIQIKNLGNIFLCLRPGTHREHKNLIETALLP